MESNIIQTPVMIPSEVADFLGVSEKSLPFLMKKGLPSILGKGRFARFLTSSVKSWKSDNAELIRAVQSEKLKLAKQKHGYVYLFKCLHRYKIGSSRNPRKRMSTMQSPFPVEKLHLIRCSDMKASERALHRQFAAKRVHGEWFELNEKDVEYILTIKKL